MKITKLYDDAQLPKYQSTGAAGMDLHAYEGGILCSGQQRKVSLGIAFAVPAGYEGQIRGRSGLALREVTVHLATIDSDYRGEATVLLRNIGRSVFRWNAGDRIAQLVVSPVVQVFLEEVDSLDETIRGSSGFGSTGRN